MSDLLAIPDLRYNEISGCQILKHVQSKFERFWLDEMTKTVWSKPHTYSSFKCHFGIEPYVSLIRNCNQRCHLSRLRVSARRLGCEVLRYQRPPIPRDQRHCVHCPPEPGPSGQAVWPVDDERHCLTACVIRKDDRPDLYSRLSSSNASFDSMCSEDKFKTLMCPTNPTHCKLVSRFLNKQFWDRDNIMCWVWRINSEQNNSRVSRVRTCHCNKLWHFPAICSIWFNVIWRGHKFHSPSW